jgi:hypothetical protein
MRMSQEIMTSFASVEVEPGDVLHIAGKWKYKSTIA